MEEAQEAALAAEAEASAVAASEAAREVITVVITTITIITDRLDSFSGRVLIITGTAADFSADSL